MKLTECLTELGRPVGYYPSLTAITGGAKETILLCQLAFWDGKQHDQAGWIYKSQAELTKETGLSRYEQETARRNLRRKGFLVEKLAGVPATKHYKINMDAVNRAWSDFVSGKQKEGCSSMGKNNILVCGKPANLSAETPHTITENTSEITTEKKEEAKDSFLDPLKDKRKEIKDLVQEINDLKTSKVTHGKYMGTIHPAYRLMQIFEHLPDEAKVGVLVQVFAGLFPQKGVNFPTVTAKANDMFTKILNLPMCAGPEEVLKEIVYYEGKTYTVWDVEKIFKSQEALKNSLARMRYEIDKARAKA